MTRTLTTSILLLLLTLLSGCMYTVEFKDG